MFKLYARLRKRDWVLVAIIVGLTILQVYCSMVMVDYISDIIQSITYLNYHNSFDAFASIFEGIAQQDPSMSGPINAFLGQLASYRVGTDGIDWEGLLSSTSPLSPILSMVSAESKATFDAIANASTEAIWFNGGMMVLVATGLAACQIVIEVMASYITSHFATDIRSHVNAKISSFSLAEINRFSTASLITRTTNDIQQVSMATLMMLRMIFAAPVTAIWAICKIQAVSYQLTLATGIAIVLLVLVLVLIMGLVLPQFKIMQKRIDRINSLTQENLTGIRVVRAFNAEKYQEGKFEKANLELTKTQLFTGRMLNLMSPAMMIIMNGLTLAVYWIGAYLMQKGNDYLTYANVSAFSSLATQIVMSFMMLLMMFILWPRASVSARRINDVLETKNSIVDPTAEKKTTEVGTVEFKDVSFRYPDADADILEHISFKAKKGDTVAFIGSTGSGKSTLVNLVTRLYDCTDGEVLIDGVNVKDIKQETLRKKIGFVPQKGVLFSGTVRSNVGFGLPTENLSNEECDRALDIACAHEFVDKMEGKEDALISQGGTNVSGGQRQRLCIARAVAIHPEIYVFDDSFSALDFKTDHTVRDNLKNEEKEATKLIVAQRIGTIMDADEILVLQEGKVVGQGTHRELLENCPVYRDIALSQLSKEELGL